MEKKYLVSETTKEERKEIVKNALGISLLGADMPSNDVLQLAKQYIDGKIEIEEIQKRVLEKYTNGGNKQLKTIRPPLLNFGSFSRYKSTPYSQLPTTFILAFKTCAEKFFLNTRFI